MNAAGHCEWRTSTGFMHWLRNYAFGSHLVDWIALAGVVVLTFAMRLAARRLILPLLTRKRGSDKNEMEYWRKHGE
jgi:hypothetical protein